MPLFQITSEVTIRSVRAINAVDEAAARYWNKVMVRDFFDHSGFGFSGHAKISRVNVAPMGEISEAGPMPGVNPRKRRQHAAK